MPPNGQDAEPPNPAPGRRPIRTLWAVENRSWAGLVSVLLDTPTARALALGRSPSA